MELVKEFLLGQKIGDIIIVVMMLALIIYVVSSLLKKSNWCDKKPLKNKSVNPKPSPEPKETNTSFMYPPTDKYVDNICLSYRHDFGLMDADEKYKYRFKCREWMRAINNNPPNEHNT